jgi:hypothetical protein
LIVITADTELLILRSLLKIILNLYLLLTDTDNMPHLLKTIIYRSHIISVIVVLSGCFAVQYEMTSKVPEKLKGYRSQITAGESTRKEVHERLGKTIAGNNRVEVFRVEGGYDVIVDAFWGVIPVWWQGTEEVIIYALVIYDDSNVVEAIDWGIYEHDPDDVLTGYGSDWGSSAQQAEFRSASLTAHGYTFISIKEGFGFNQKRKDFLLAPQSETQSYMDLSPPQGKCAILYFFNKPYNPKKFYIDGKLVGEVPLMHVTAITASLKVFAKMLVEEGSHEILIDTPIKPHKFRNTISCESQKRFFVYPSLNKIRTEPKSLFGVPWKYEGGIDVRDAAQESHNDWRRLLFYNGRWIGDE